MRLKKSWHGLVAAGAIGLMASSAMANEPASTEAQLEQRIAELEAQLENVMTQMQTNSTAQTTLESRIAELQTSMAAEDGNDMGMYWNNGIRFDSANKQFNFKFGGRIQNDYAWFDADSDATGYYGNGSLNSGTEFRRARLYVAGTIYGNVGFKAQYDFAGGDADFKDVYLSMKTCAGNVTVGHHYVPFGLEEQTSSKYTTFMERSFAAGFAPSRQTGVSLDFGSVLHESLNLRTGVFRNVNDYGDDNGPMRTDGAYLWAVRGSGVIMADDEKDMALSIGGSYAIRAEPEGTNAAGLPDNQARFRSRGGQHIGPRWVDTGTIAVDDDTQLMGLDAAFVMGPLHAQAEWATADVDAVGGSADLDAWAIQAGWFLTGETRAWKGDNWDRTSPAANWGDENGMGAWEVAARYDTIDLNDGAASGGEADQWTLGLNWYLNPNTRIMFNYVMASMEDLATGTPFNEKAEVDVFEMRFQVDF